MGRALAVGLLLLCGGRASAQGGGVPFAAVLPADVGDVSSWTVVSGDFETAEHRGAYRLYVSPARRAIYQLMRYRVQFLSPRTPLERRRRSGERVIFVRRPGAREPLRCWERTPLEAGSGWREVQAGTDEYRLEMRTLMHVLAIHQAARTRSTP